MSAAEKEAAVDGVITEMGLEAAKDTYIGNWHLRGISGGQVRTRWGLALSDGAPRGSGRPPPTSALLP